MLTPPPAAGINDAASPVVFVLAIFYGLDVYQCKYDEGGGFQMVKEMVWDCDLAWLSN